MGCVSSSAFLLLNCEETQACETPTGGHGGSTLVLTLRTLERFMAGFSEAESSEIEITVQSLPGGVEAVRIAKSGFTSLFQRRSLSDDRVEDGRERGKTGPACFPAV